MQKLRKELPQKFPGLTFYFAASDIATQVLNFGLPAPIDVQVARAQRATQEQNLEIAEAAAQADRGACPAPWTCTSHQVTKTPDLRVQRGPHDGRARSG